MSTLPVSAGVPRLPQGSGAALIGVALAVPIGLLAGLSPALAIAAAIGIGFCLVVLTDLGLGIAAFTIVGFLEVVPSLGGPALSLAKVAGLLLFLSWLARIDRSSGLAFFRKHPVLSYLMVAFLAWSTVSVLWANDPGDALTATSRYALNFALLPIAYTAVARRRDALAVGGAFVFGAVVAALFGIVTQPSAAQDLDRLAGSIGDPNELAATLVAGAVIAFALAGTAKSGSAARALGFLLAAICLLGVFMTLSRGGLVAFVGTVLAALVLGGRYRSTIAAFAGLGIVVALLFLAFFAPDGAVERLTTSDGATGRTSTWTVGLRMFNDNPGAGVGSGNFASSSIGYLLEPGSLERSDFVLDRSSVAHNAYLEIGSELGLPGVILFVAIVAAALVGGMKAARLAAARGRVSDETIARGFVLAAIAILIACIFLSDQFSKQLWVLLAMGPAMLGLVQRTSELDEGHPARD